VNKKMLLRNLLLIILISGLVMAGTAGFDTVKAAINVTGLIDSNTTWAKASSPYNLIDHVVGANDVTLTIESGVTVNLEDSYMQINGTLRALWATPKKT
jgi:hypothetical protein